MAKTNRIWISLASLLSLCACESSIETPIEPVPEVQTASQEPLARRVPPSSDWKDLGDESEPLQNYPYVEVAGLRPGTEDGLIEVVNRGQTSLRYYGYSAESFAHYREVRVAGEWKSDGWDWCGTGLEAHVLEPGQRVRLRCGMRASETDSIRVLTWFDEVGTDRSEMVVMALYEVP